MKLHRFLYFLSAMFVLLIGSSCTSTTQGFNSSEYKKENIKCKVLSDVSLGLTPFTAGPLFTSFVKIQILEPEYLKNEDAELILQSKMSKDYTGPLSGQLWKEIGSVHVLTVFINIQSSRIYLYPEASAQIKDQPNTQDR